MRVQLVGIVEVDPAEVAFRMPAEPLASLSPRSSTLFTFACADFAFPDVDLQAGGSEEGVFVRKDLLVLRAELAQDEPMNSAGMPLEVGPAGGDDVAGGVRTVEAEEGKEGVELFAGFAGDGELGVGVREGGGREGLERGRRVGGEDDARAVRLQKDQPVSFRRGSGATHLAERAPSLLVERT